jgi:hypothetical protein
MRSRSAANAVSGTAEAAEVIAAVRRSGVVGAAKAVHSEAAAGASVPFRDQCLEARNAP